MIPPDEPLSHRWPGITYAHVRAELQRQAAQRARSDPGRIAKGELDQAEAEHQQALLAALLDDLAALLACQPCPASRFAWPDKRAALTRELRLRRRFYPQWIAKGELDQREADRRVACLEALLSVYDGGWGWLPLNGVMPGYGVVAASDAQLDSRDEWAATAAALAGERPEAQKEMAL